MLCLFKTALVLFALLNIVIFLLGYRYPEFVQILRQEIKKKRYERSTLTGLDLDHIGAKLTRLMEEENLFCDETINMQKVAEALSITSHQLSEYLNTHLNINFKTFINTCRVEDAKRLLLEEPNETVLSIAYAVGFNSQSAFYKAFSAIAGTTPAKYRKNPDCFVSEAVNQPAANHPPFLINPPRPLRP